MQAAVKEYEDTKATCTAWPLEQVTHVFYHILIKDTSKAFDGDYKEADYNQVMTTIDEFNKITQTMYDKGYVMVSIKDMAKADENGNITAERSFFRRGKRRLSSHRMMCVIIITWMETDLPRNWLWMMKGRSAMNMWKMMEVCL